MITGMNGDAMDLPFPSDDEVLGQWCDFKASWWEKYVPVELWPSGLTGLPSSTDRPGYQRINRQDVFALAADNTPQGRVGLLLGAYIWGTGPSAFLVARPPRPFPRPDIGQNGPPPQAVYRPLGSEGPIAAFAHLPPGPPNPHPIPRPTFLPKYMYFAAGH